MLQTVSRAVQCLLALAEQPGGLTLTELTKAVGSNKATVHRIVATLKRFDLVAATIPSGRLKLGARCAVLGGFGQSHTAIRELARPYLTRLAGLISEAGEVGARLRRASRRQQRAEVGRPDRQAVSPHRRRPREGAGGVSARRGAEADPRIRAARPVHDGQHHGPAPVRASARAGARPGLCHRRERKRARIGGVRRGHLRSPVTRDRSGHGGGAGRAPLAATAGRDLALRAPRRRRALARSAAHRPIRRVRSRSSQLRLPRRRGQGGHELGSRTRTPRPCIAAFARAAAARGGASCVDSWIEANFDRCSALMECDKPTTFGL